MTKSPSEEETRDKIIDAVKERSEGTPPKLAGFVFEDLLYGLGVTSKQIASAMEYMMQEEHWAQAQRVLDRISDVLMEESDEGTTSEGYVYLFKCGTLFKIGTSKDPASRLSAINRNIPPNGDKVLSFMKFKVKSPKKAEKYLHDQLDSKRLQGDTGGVEWFALSVADIDWIKTVMRQWLG